MTGEVPGFLIGLILGYTLGFVTVFSILYMAGKIK